MSLYVRLQTSFWTHRKTLRLRAAIGDDALWLPPRMWSYAAQNQPDGDFSGYSATELALLLGYAKDPQAMLEAMQRAGFLEGMKIHDWQEHNGYHEVFATRAKAAAEARWKKEKSDKTGKDQIRQEASIAVSNASSTKEPSEPSKKKGTLEEIRAFCSEIELPESDGDSCFHRWEGNGWKNGNAQIKCWRSTIRSWKAAGYMPSQKRNVRNGSSGRKMFLTDHSEGL